ncbi:MAG TPA: hypothetical protein VFV38_17735 [Ktedonobacteraceae bacterium]|nr:hypothetical protein [Ktedonobacteraceae bacterium]
MTLLPFLDCCSLLGVDPKTLRLWLKAAQIGLTPHPTDARLKCLASSQLFHLATLHGRSLPASLPGEAGELASSAQTAVALSRSHGPSVETSVSDADLRHQLSLLQARLATLEAHVTDLALALMRERTSPSNERAMSPLNPPPVSQVRAHPLAPHCTQPLPCEVTPPPIRPRAPSRALPLIECRADGTYLVLSPTVGVLAFEPDSPEWFAWLATITAFTFVGAHGRFSVRRKSLHGQFTKCWRAYRVVHHHQYWFYVGLTDHLTIARLEQVAINVQTRLATL